MPLFMVVLTFGVDRNQMLGQGVSLTMGTMLAPLADANSIGKDRSMGRRCGIGGRALCR